jgi:hypothetical protein
MRVDVLASKAAIRCHGSIRRSQAGFISMRLRSQPSHLLFLNQ